MQSLADGVKQFCAGVLPELESRSCAVLKVEGFDGVVQATRCSHDRNGAIAQAINLVEAARFVFRRHQKDVGARFHQMGQPVIVTNDGDQPISIANLEIKLITSNHSKLTPISTDDLYRRLSNPQSSTRPSPIPLPHKVKGGISKKEMDEIESSQFAAKAVEPHGTQSGFLFFDVGGILSPLPGANLDITGVADAKGSELLFFEISIDKYLNAPKNPD